MTGRSGDTEMKFAPLLSFAVFAATSLALPASGADVQRVYFGTYGSGPGEGIFVAELDPATGVITTPRLAAEAVDASFLAFDPAHTALYAVSEVSTLDGKKTGGVVGFTIDKTTSRLTRQSEQPSLGAGPCHLVVDKTGKNVLVANYDGGTAAVLPILEPGRLHAASSWVAQHGHGPNSERRKKPTPIRSTSIRPTVSPSSAISAATRFLYIASTPPPAHSKRTLPPS